MMRKITSTALAMGVVMALTAGCAGNNEGGNPANPASPSGSGSASQPADSSGNSSSGTDNASNHAEKGGDRVVTVFVDASQTGGAYQDMLNDFTDKTGIKVEQVVLPGTGQEALGKIDVSLLSGDETDVLRMQNPIVLNKYQTNDMLLPLNDLAKADGYDADRAYGDYMAKDKDGTFYSLPNAINMWAVYYNKSIFDKAGVPYPEGSWTWDEYIDTAKRLTDESKNIYGSYMLLHYDNYKYFLAKQKGISAYKEDGTSNYDDPSFKESLQFMKDLGDMQKIQPSYMEYQTKKLPWDGFMSGNYGMTLISSWYSSVLTDPKAYPHDWKWGIAPTPTADGGTNNLVNVSYYGVNKNAAHPEEAFEFLKYMGEQSYLISREIPARVDLSEAEFNDFFRTIADKSDGSVTSGDLYKAMIDNGLGVVDEKILGSIPEEYSSIVNQESEKFFYGQQSLDATLAVIKKRADEAIANAGKE